MAKRIVSCVLLLMVISLCYAGETPREPTYTSAGKTTFTNIEVVGLNNDAGTNPLLNGGTPGYVQMTNPSGARFFLWVGHDGRLRIASEIAVGWGASPSVVEWRDASGEVIGSQ